MGGDVLVGKPIPTPDQLSGAGFFRDERALTPVFAAYALSLRHVPQTL